MSTCISVGVDGVGRSRLRRALAYLGHPGDGSRVRAFPDWNAAWRACRTAPVGLVVFDPFPPGKPPLTGSAAFAAAHPAVRLVGYGRLPVEHAALVPGMLRGGTHAFVSRDVDDTPQGFAFHLRRAGVIHPTGSGTAG